jgi:tRNA modification GTPase
VPSFLGAQIGFSIVVLKRLAIGFPEVDKNAFMTNDVPWVEDTIVAVATAPGPGGRAIIRLSGSRALTIARSLFSTHETIVPQRRRVYTGSCHVPNISSELPAQLLVFPGPRSYTGQEVVELHVWSVPVLVDWIIAGLLAGGARPAQPGEFTQRAFLAGKLDLPRAEAVLAVIESGDRDELRQALKQMAGGVSRPLEGLREDLLNLLADLEAGLDFTEEDIEFVNKPETLIRLARGLAQVTLVQKQVQERSLGDRPFRVALVGPPNAGKSSLFNALAGTHALISDVPGTTRDYLIARLEIRDQLMELIDTAGWQASRDAIDAAAQQLGREVALTADLVLICTEGGHAWPVPMEVSAAVIAVATKCDQVKPPRDHLATSATTGQGLDQLKTVLASKARARSSRGLAPSLSRCQHHVETCLDHLRRAHQGVLFDDPPEIVALELRSALEHLGGLTGAVHTDDLLDRIFSRFCIGK